MKAIGKCRLLVNKKDSIGSLTLKTDIIRWLQRSIWRKRDYSLCS